MRYSHGMRLEHSPKDRSRRDKHFAPTFSHIATVFTSNSLVKHEKFVKKNIISLSSMGNNYDYMLKYSPNDRSHRDEHFAPMYRPVATILMDEGLVITQN